jgi:AcrR family transcriptional regulator
VTATAHERTRNRILDVALQLFAERGFAATSTREISERLGFTKAALYYHFRTKDELLEALLEPAFSGLRALAATDLDPSPSARRAVIAGYVDLVAANAELIRVLTQDPSVASRSEITSHKQLFDRLGQLLSGNEQPSVAEITRVRAAIGGVHTALVFAEPGDDPATVRAAALAAACGALGIPAPRGQ